MSSKDEKKSKNENHKAINRAKNQVKILRDTVNRQGQKINSLEEENERLKKENEQLKKELAATREIPKWVKANKSEEAKKSAKKKGPKKGHAPHVRKTPDKVDQTIVVFPESCPEGYGDLPFPSDSKWYTHVQIDLPEPSKAIITRASSKFEDGYDDLKTSLHDQSHLHVDETGWRVDGTNVWLWSFSNADVSVYTIDPSRSQKVVEEILGEVFSGVLCSDFYGAYNKIDSQKQKCWAHILRDLHQLREKHPQDLEICYFSARPLEGASH